MSKLLSSYAELTDREIEILKFVARGYSAKQTAQELNIAPRTVECHINTMKLKMRARNRAHMVAIAIAAKNLLDTTLTDELAGAELPEVNPMLATRYRELAIGRVAAGRRRGCAT